MNKLSCTWCAALHFGVGTYQTSSLYSPRDELKTLILGI